MALPHDTLISAMIARPVCRICFDKVHKQQQILGKLGNQLSIRDYEPIMTLLLSSTMCQALLRT